MSTQKILNSSDFVERVKVAEYLRKSGKFSMSNYFFN